MNGEEVRPRRRWPILMASLLVVISLAALLAATQRIKALAHDRVLLEFLVKELELNGRYENRRAEAWREEAIKLRDAHGLKEDFEAETLYPRLNDAAFDRERPRDLR